MLKGSANPAEPLDFHPVEGVEAKEKRYIDWLLAGGEPIDLDAGLLRAWEETQPIGL